MRVTLPKDGASRSPSPSGSMSRSPSRSSLKGSPVLGTRILYERRSSQRLDVHNSPRGHDGQESPSAARRTSTWADFGSDDGIVAARRTRRSIGGTPSDAEDGGRR